jgi:AraC-like DNA-binding protein
MLSVELDDNGMRPSVSTASALSSLCVYEVERDMPRIAIPRSEAHLVVRFGPSARGGVDIHAFGAQGKAHRKQLRAGQRMVMARLRLGAQMAVFGVPASALAGRIVSLEDLWGQAATRPLVEELEASPSTWQAAAVLECAVAARIANAAFYARPSLALKAAAKLTDAAVNVVADELGVSERHLRRVFREAVGVSPKAFAKLARFHRALSVARADAQANWASIATAVGYYDQAHLIADFRLIAGATPQTLLGELRARPSGA